MNWRLTRNDTSAFVEFDQDMLWADEHDWNAIENNVDRALSGSVIIQQGLKQAGRPITLEAEWVWHRLDAVRTLRDWTDTPELEMTLDHYDGRTFNVTFRQQDGALIANPVVYRTPEIDSHQYIVTINLMTV